MAFVPYVPSVLPVPTALSTSSRKILPATTSTYVYSKPVTSSYSCSTTILIPHSHLVSKEVNKNVAPGLLLNLSILFVLSNQNQAGVLSGYNIQA